MPDVDMRVELAGVTLKNPVCVASGTFGFGREYGAFYDLGELDKARAVVQAIEQAQEGLE